MHKLLPLLRRVPRVIARVVKFIPVVIAALNVVDATAKELGELVKKENRAADRT